MNKPILNISCPSGISYKSEINVGGDTLSNVYRAEIILEPEKPVYAKLDVYASLTEVQAVFDAFPIWEHIGTAPKDGKQILVCVEPEDAQSSWWMTDNERWANWDRWVEPKYWAPLPMMPGTP